jgi:hypothetical protein
MFGRTNDKKIVVYKNEEKSDFKILENIKILDNKKTLI